MKDRFEIIIAQSLNRAGYIEVLKDKQTGVLYLHRADHSGCGLTVLVDKDGKPCTS